MIIRAKTFKSWLLARFDKNQLRDMSQHGANVGWQGLSYYHDTCQLYNKFKEEIWEFLCDDAEEFGCENVFEFMSTFGEAKSVSNCTQFENLMVWYAAEKLAHQFTS